MSDADREALVRYRLGQASHALNQARLLESAGEWDGVVNRAYYAMFYGALALLLTKDLGSSKHAGVLALVDREFVRAGVFPAGMSRRLREAFNLRQRADYGEFVPATEAEARSVLAGASEFLAEIRRAVGVQDEQVTADDP